MKQNKNRADYPDTMSRFLSGFVVSDFLRGSIAPRGAIFGAILDFSPSRETITPIGVISGATNHE